MFTLTKKILPSHGTSLNPLCCSSCRTASNGTTWTAATRSRSSARTSRDISSTPDNNSPASESHKQTNKQFSILCHLSMLLQSLYYLLFFLFFLNFTSTKIPQRSSLQSLFPFLRPLSLIVTILIPICQNSKIPDPDPQFFILFHDQILFKGSQSPNKLSTTVNSWFLNIP